MRKRIAALLSLACLALLISAAPPASASIPGYPAAPSICAHVGNQLTWGDGAPSGSYNNLIRKAGTFCRVDAHTHPGWAFVLFFNSNARLVLAQCGEGANYCTNLWIASGWNDPSAQLVLAPNCSIYITTDPFTWVYRSGTSHGWCELAMDNTYGWEDVDLTNWQAGNPYVWHRP